MSSTTSAESFGVKLNYNGQMRRFPIALGTSFKDLRAQVIALLALPHDVDVALKYSDEEGDLITISSDLELNSALVPGSLLRLTAIDKKPTAPTGPASYPILDAPMLDAAPTAPLLHGVADGTRSFGGVPHGHGAPPGFGPAPGFAGPVPCAPGFENMGPHGFGGPHRGGHHGPYRGGLGFRGGCGPHGRGGFGHHGRHGFGPYGPHMPPHAAMTPEDWRAYKKDCKDMKKDCKEMHKDMRREWKDSRKCLKKDWREGRGRCSDGMQWGVAPGAADERLVARFAKDVTIPDGTQLAPNTPFVKTWRLRNEGAAWPAGCVLRFLGKKSDRMSCPETVPLPADGPVATNAEIDVSVNLVAPEKPGRYTGYFKLSTPDGRKFGQRVWVSIVVPGSHSSSSSSDSDREADRYEAMVDVVLATGLKAKRHRILRMLKKTDGQVDVVCEKLVKKQEKMARKAMKKQMKM